jgi:radical SAM superfamily enzyme YgiQ (UPF0313 family)
MDILLINPGKFRGQLPNEHLGILSLKSFVRSKGFEAEVMDMAIENLAADSALPMILEMNPETLGISMLDDTKSMGFSLIKKVKAAGYRGKIILGGYFPTFSSTDILNDFPEVDFIVRGEGENLSRPLISDLDILPPVDRKYAAACIENKQPLRVYATRGCWGGCSFCDIISLYGHSRGKQWRRRGVNKLVDELADLRKTYQTSHFIFNDDQFLVKGKRAMEYVEQFAAAIEDRDLDVTFDLMCRADTVTRQVMQRLKSIGLKRVFLGLESFDPKQLERYQKGISVRQNLRALHILKGEKVDVIASVILADAYTTLFDLLKQFAVLFQLTRRYFNSKECQISVNKKLEVYRGSKVYKEYKEKSLLTRDNYLEGYDFKLKLLTHWRLKVLTMEERIGRGLSIALKYLIARVRMISNLIKKGGGIKQPVTLK